MEKLSVTIITKNEELNIERCLDALKWADEILVVDSGSVDGTLDICRRYGCKIIEIQWMGFGKTKKFAVDNAKYDWILSVDADEVVSQELKENIQSILNRPQFNGYKINRKSYYLGKMIKYCGWQNDLPLRLFNRNFGNFNEKIIHEYVDMREPIGIINECILHYTYQSVNQHFDRMKNYAVLSAMEKFELNKNSSIIKALCNAVLKFFKMYIIKFGFLDGKNGLLLSFNSSIGIYLKYINLWEMNKMKISETRKQ
ncbi:MAG: glycosyltransferase family 2 protein [bacterium]